MTAQELVDILCPEHGRTSCDDEHIDNGFYKGPNLPRCPRCALLELANGTKTELSSGIEADVVFSRC